MTHLFTNLTFSTRDGMMILWGLASLLIFALGFWLGDRRGRKKEYAAWQKVVVPEMKRLECERDQLWRSSVSKKQKLNRLMREMKRL